MSEIAPSATDSVGALIVRLRCGDDQAADSLFSRYFEALVELAHRTLLVKGPVAIDEEDIALESLASLFHGLRSGKFQTIDNRLDLWTLLVVVTLRRVHKVARATCRERLAIQPNSPRKCNESFHRSRSRHTWSLITKHLSGSSSGSTRSWRRSSSFGSPAPQLVKSRRNFAFHLGVSSVSFPLFKLSGCR